MRFEYLCMLYLFILYIHMVHIDVSPFSKGIDLFVTQDS